MYERLFPRNYWYSAESQAESSAWCRTAAERGGRLHTIIRLFLLVPRFTLCSTQTRYLNCITVT